MRIELHEITIREIAKGYIDNAEEGVKGYGGLLNIRPKYQREFVYDESKRNAVIDTIVKGFPLNVMYWVKNEDGNFEVLDGQQRTISFCQYVNGDFSLNNRAFHNLTAAEQDEILNYKCMVYFCEGNDKEKLEWFKTINIAGEKLTDQELRNAVYTGEWLTSAKLKFSKSNCAAYNLGNKYVNGSPIRQDYLETAISWINDGKIEEYMMDDDVTNKKGIYFYVLTRNEKYLNIRAFTESQKRAVYERQNGNCPHCIAEHREKVHYELSEMEADHITPWCEGGKTEIDNCQLLCKEHNRRKSDK